MEIVINVEVLLLISEPLLLFFKCFLRKLVTAVRSL
jgi:hypothetical protein